MQEGDQVEVIKGDFRGKSGTLIEIEHGDRCTWAIVDIDGTEEILRYSEIRKKQKS